MKKCLLISLGILLLNTSVLVGQDTLLLRLANENVKEFNYKGGEFDGDGWDFLVNKAASSQNVLVGEDHFSNEIPAFIKALSNTSRFDNFYIEVDPYTTKIIENTFKLSSTERKHFNAIYSDLFSFYALKPEYDLLQHMVKSGAKLLGSDQIVMFDDRLIFQDLAQRTKNPKAKTIYISVAEKSRLAFEAFLSDPQNPMYFMTREFIDQLKALEKLELSKQEDEIIQNMYKSVTIYKSQNHRMRVQLILHHLMEDYPKWKDSRNLFKYGANHLARGESFLTVFDVGNVVANVTASNFKESFHIMIVGESGEMGSIFRGFPNAPVDAEKGFYLSYLKPFFSLTGDTSWTMFDLTPLRKAVDKKQLQIENLNLERVIKGYDALVIIPEVTPAGF